MIVSCCERCADSFMPGEGRLPGDQCHCGNTLEAPSPQYLDGYYADDRMATLEAELTQACEFNRRLTADYDKVRRERDTLLSRTVAPLEWAQHAGGLISRSVFGEYLTFSEGASAVFLDRRQLFRLTWEHKGTDDELKAAAFAHHAGLVAGLLRKAE